MPSDIVSQASVIPIARVDNSADAETGDLSSSSGVAAQSAAQLALAHARCTDVGNARRLVNLHGSRLRYVYPMAAWLVYHAGVWRLDTTGEVMRLAKATVVNIYREAAAISDSTQRRQLAAWADTSESETRLNAMINLARPELAVAPDALDAHPWLLNVQNGTVDLRTLDLLPHSAGHLLTRIAAVPYDPEARSPLFDRVLRHALPDDSVRRFAQTLAGCTLCGENGADVVVLVHGPTRTSKGTIQEAFAAAIGDYAVTAELDLLAERDRPGGPRPELVRLRGARMVSIYETSRRLKLSASLAKTFSGSDPITARDLYGKPLTFRPQATLWLATNYRPKAASDDDALWTRIRELPFTVTIPEAERDPTVRAQLRDPRQHGAAILAWAIEGCRRWKADGLHQPDAVRAATQSYRDEMDPLRSFIAECCRLQPTAWTASDQLRTEYERYARENGERAVDGAHFRDGLRHLGCTPDRRHAGRGWRGIGLAAMESVTV